MPGFKGRHVLYGSPLFIRYPHASSWFSHSIAPIEACRTFFEWPWFVQRRATAEVRIIPPALPRSPWGRLSCLGLLFFPDRTYICRQ